MTSPEELDRYFNQLRAYGIRNQKQFKKIEETQRANEKEIIERSSSFCPLRQIQDMTTTSDQVALALKEGFDDPNILRSLMCINNSVAIFPEVPGEIGPSFKIRHYLRDLQQIGGESAEGYAMTAEVRPLEEIYPDNNLNVTMKSPSTVVMGSTDSGRPFVAKSPRQITTEGNANQLHEYFVGAFGTNPLRAKIPNFAFIMGFFQCSPPYIDKESYVTDDPSDDKRKALTYCENTLTTNQVNYILLENIANSKTLAGFIRDGCSFPDYLNVLTQVVLALNIATEVGFTHYDLHSQNVLVLQLPEPMYILYDGVGYIKTQHLAFIIDYGRSHIIYAGTHFGFNGTPIGIFPNRAYPMFDVYKILLFSLLDAAFGESNYLQYRGISDTELERRGLLTNAQVFQQGKAMVAYFYPQINLDEVAQYLIVTRKHFYTLPYSPDFDLPPIDFFTNAMGPLYEPILFSFIQQDPPANIDSLYGCARKGVCTTLQGALSQYADPDADFMNDPYVFYEMLYEAVAGNAKLVDLNRLKQSGFQYYQTYIDKLTNDAQNKLNRYQAIFSRIAPSNLRATVPEWVKFSPQSLELYRKHVAKVVRLVDLMNELLEIERITVLFNRIYPQRATEPLYLNELAQLKQTIPRLNAFLASITADAQYILTIKPENILQINPDAKWLFEKLPGVPVAVTPITI